MKYSINVFLQITITTTEMDMDTTTATVKVVIAQRTQCLLVLWMKRYASYLLYYLILFG